MSRFLLVLVFVLGCGPQAESEPTADEPQIPEEFQPIWEARLELAARAPELEACNQALLEAEAWDAGAIEYIDGSLGYSFIEVPCGRAPGTGAYGWPFALLVQRPGRLEAVEFSRMDGNGNFVSDGYVTQAIPDYERSEELLIDILYKYAGAGQCGFIAGYEVPAEGSPLALTERRERKCDDPCEDDSCYDPANWPSIPW